MVRLRARSSAQWLRNGTSLVLSANTGPIPPSPNCVFPPRAPFVSTRRPHAVKIGGRVVDCEKKALNLHILRRCVWLSVLCLLHTRSLRDWIRPLTFVSFLSLVYFYVSCKTKRTPFVAFTSIPIVSSLGQMVQFGIFSHKTVYTQNVKLCKIITIVRWKRKITYLNLKVTNILQSCYTYLGHVYMSCPFD